MIKLAERQLAAAARPGPKPYEIAVGPTPGLRLSVRPSGAMSWCLRYRAGGRGRKLVFAPYPGLPLPEARKVAAGLYEQVASGRDPAVLAAGAAAPPAAHAAEKTVTLVVQNMTCALCPRTVKASLEAVAGVSKVVVSAENKTASVTYDDSKAGVDALVNATTSAGYPSAPKS